MSANLRVPPFEKALLHKSKYVHPPLPQCFFVGDLRNNAFSKGKLLSQQFVSHKQPLWYIIKIYKEFFEAGRRGRIRRTLQRVATIP
jgi:hypothetical protein